MAGRRRGAAMSRCRPVVLLISCPMARRLCSALCGVLRLRLGRGAIMAPSGSIIVVGRVFVARYILSCRMSCIMWGAAGVGRGVTWLSGMRLRSPPTGRGLRAGNLRRRLDDMPSVSTMSASKPSGFCEIRWFGFVARVEHKPLRKVAAHALVECAAVGCGGECYVYGWPRAWAVC